MYQADVGTHFLATFDNLAKKQNKIYNQDIQMNTKYKTYLFETANIPENWEFVCGLNECDYIIACKETDKIQGFIRFKNQRHCDSVSRTIFCGKALLRPSTMFDTDCREMFITNPTFYENGKPLRKKRKTRDSQQEKEKVERELLVLKEENEQKTKQLELQNQLINQQCELLKQQIQKTPSAESDNFQQLMNMCLTLAKSNATVAENLTVYSNSIIQNNNNSNNNNNSKIKNKFNLNFFLNEQCKDAINLIDFVKGIQLELNDMILHNKVGYADAISTIFNKELNKMELTKRPVHCTDLKREVIYVKDDGKWQNDENHEIADKAITILSTRNYLQMKKWKEENPNYLTNPEKNVEYIKLTKNLMGGSTDQEQDANSKKIIKSIAKTTHLDKEDAIV